MWVTKSTVFIAFLPFTLCKYPRQFQHFTTWESSGIVTDFLDDRWDVLTSPLNIHSWYSTASCSYLISCKNYSYAKTAPPINIQPHLPRSTWFDVLLHLSIFTSSSKVLRHLHKDTVYIPHLLGFENWKSSEAFLSCFPITRQVKQKWVTPHYYLYKIIGTEIKDMIKKENINLGISIKHLYLWFVRRWFCFVKPERLKHCTIVAYYKLHHSKFSSLGEFYVQSIANHSPIMMTMVFDLSFWRQPSKIS